MFRRYASRGEWSDRARRRAEWMRAAQAGNAEAYATLLDDIGPMLLTYLRRRVRNPAHAEDLYQDVLLSVHRARHTYEPARPIEPWLFAIARHIAAEHEQRERNRRAHEILIDAPPDTPVHCDGYAKPAFEQALGYLTAEQREALTLLRVRGLPLDDAARHARVSTGALKVRAHRAYRTLRTLL